MKNSKKNAATTKKDYQAALMKKAAKKANATSVVDSVNTDNISITADAESKWQSTSVCIGIPFVKLSGN